jgi:diguanylate cyclase (GGDEF)-like protein/PAS domain S-box-containing protein
MRLARRHGWWTTAVAVLALTALARALGLFQTLEFAADDARARLLMRAVRSDIVIVGIDAQSLAALDRWPWPRRHHARLLERLAEAQPRRVFLDIDFSSRSNALDDAVLESALARFRGEPVVLPAFFQRSSATDSRLVLREPLERFARHATVAAVNRESSHDGLERRWRSDWTVGGRTLRSVIDPDRTLPAGTEVRIDYALSPASFQYVSFVDVLEGRVDDSRLRGKTVYVGATAVELGDMVAVPVHRSLPGVVVQALAAESVRAGPLRDVGGAWLLATLAGWTFLAALLMDGRRWRRNAGILAGALALAAGASLHLYARHGLALEVVPFALAAAAVFLATVLRSLDRESWRALRFALGMRRRDALLKSIVLSSSDCIICLDDAGRIRTATPAAESLFGCDEGKLIGASVARFVPGLAVAAGDQPEALAALEGRITEWEALHAGGRAFPVELALSRVRFEGERLYTAIVRDISERKSHERRLEHQATHDSLTGLPNRAALMQQLGAALARAGGSRPIALLMLDLCRFKEVNDTLGHGVGDEVLTEVARRFQAALADRGLVARVGGDEFVAMIDMPGGQSDVEAASLRLARCLRKPIDVAGVSIEVGLSIGIARAPEDAADPETLLTRADVAMYVAKRRGSAFEIYDAALDENSVRRLSLGTDLRTAIARDALELWYQPQVDLRSGRPSGAEALLRWTHPVHGPVSPAEFIAFAESTDLIRPLTEWTLRRALADAAAWRDAGTHIRVAVNLSARLLQDTAFPSRLAGLLREAGVEPTSLELEITESAMMQDPARALDIIREIDRLGVLIAIDDFGSGYSSLAYLRDLPAHSLKLDKAFVTGMRTRAGDRVIVESTAQMAHALSLEIVAEGIENEWEARFLAAAGYDYGQGYHFAAAMPTDECAKWIARYDGACLRTGTHAC